MVLWGYTQLTQVNHTLINQILDSMSQSSTMVSLVSLSLMICIVQIHLELR